jgi:hypothetical protein
VRAREAPVEHESSQLKIVIRACARFNIAIECGRPY